MSEEQRGSGLDRDDAADLTDSSTSEVSEAWHDARNAAEAEGEIARGSGPGESHPGEATEALSLDASKADPADDSDDGDANDADGDADGDSDGDSGGGNGGDGDG